MFKTVDVCNTRVEILAQSSEMIFKNRNTNIFQGDANFIIFQRSLPKLYACDWFWFWTKRNKKCAETLNLCFIFKIKKYILDYLARCLS